MKYGILLILMLVTNDLFAGMAQHTIQYDGRERQFYVHLPAGYNADRTWPVVLVFHGGGGNAASVMRQSSMNEKSNSAGFIAVYPEGTGPVVLGRRLGTFNAGRCCGFAEKNHVDDVGFVSKLIDFLQEKYRIDPNRIYATGHSNGALMAYRLACELSKKIAAIATVAAHDAFDQCSPQRPISVLHFHGTADPSADYDGGKCGGRTPGDEGWLCSSVSSYLREWATLNACSEHSKITYNHGDATCRTSTGCKNSSEVTLCTIQGGGHTWPGGRYASDRPGWPAKVGKISRDISATDLMWEFFEKHPRP